MFLNTVLKISQFCNFHCVHCIYNPRDVNGLISPSSVFISDILHVKISYWKYVSLPAKSFAFSVIELFSIYRFLSITRVIIIFVNFLFLMNMVNHTVIFKFSSTITNFWFLDSHGMHGKILPVFIKMDFSYHTNNSSKVICVANC